MYQTCTKDVKKVFRSALKYVPISLDFPGKQPIFKPASSSWPRRPRSWAWTPSTTPCTRWLATRPATARLSRTCWSVTSAEKKPINKHFLRGNRETGPLSFYFHLVQKWYMELFRPHVFSSSGTNMYHFASLWYPETPWIASISEHLLGKKNTSPKQENNIFQASF